MIGMVIPVLLAVTLAVPIQSAVINVEGVTTEGVPVATTAVPEVSILVQPDNITEECIMPFSFTILYTE